MNSLSHTTQADDKYFTPKLCSPLSTILAPGLHYRQWTHVRTYGTHVFAMDMLSSIFQADVDKQMKPMAFYRVFILVLRRFLPVF